MSLKAFIVVGLMVLIVCGVLYVSLNPIQVLIIEVAYTATPVIQDNMLKDVNFNFKVDRYFSTLQGYKVMQKYSVVEGTNKLNFLDLCLNFSLSINIFNNSTNGTLWRSAEFKFSTVAERKIQFYCDKTANVTLGDKAVVVLDARLIAWYKDQAPHIDKTLHKTFTVDIPH